MLFKQLNAIILYYYHVCNVHTSTNNNRTPTPKKNNITHITKHQCVAYKTFYKHTTEPLFCNQI